jgi:mRNA interferase RelE/StbE
VRYQTVLSAKAIKALDRLDKKTEHRILAKLDELSHNPVDPRISNQLEMGPGQRYSRVGDWRIVYEINENSKTLFIIAVQHRSRVYKR